MTPRSPHLVIGKIWALGGGLPLGIWQVSCWLRAEWDARIMIIVMPFAVVAAMVLMMLHHDLLPDRLREGVERGVTPPMDPEPEPEGGELSLPDNVPDAALRPAAKPNRSKPSRTLLNRVAPWVPILWQTAIAWTLVEVVLLVGGELSKGAISAPMHAGLNDAAVIFGLLVILVISAAYAADAARKPSSAR